MKRLVKLLLVVVLAVPVHGYGASVGGWPTEKCEATSPFASQLAGLCSALENSTLCEEFKKSHPEDSLQCDQPPEEKPSFWDYAKACGEGAISDFKEVWKFLKSMVLAVTDADGVNLSEMGKPFKEFVQTSSTYLLAEYQRNYDEASSPAKHLKAVYGVSKTLLDAVFDVVGQIVLDEVGGAVCMNAKARLREACNKLPLLLAGGAGLLIKKLKDYFKKGGKVLGHDMPKTDILEKELNSSADVPKTSLINGEKLADRVVDSNVDDIMYTYSYMSERDRAKFPASGEYFKKYKGDREFAEFAESYAKKNPDALGTDLAKSTLKAFAERSPSETAQKAKAGFLNLDDASLSQTVSRKSKLYGDPHETTQYQQQVSRLRESDEIVATSAEFGARRMALGEFRGAGQTTHVYDLKDDDTKVLRLPFNSQGSGDNANRNQMTKLFVEERKKYENIPDLNVVAIHDYGKNYDYVVVDKIKKSRSADTVLDRYFDLSEKRRRTPAEEAEFQKLEPVVERLNDLAPRIADASGKSVRSEPFHSNDMDAWSDAAYNELRQVGVTEDGQFYLLDWE